MRGARLIPCETRVFIVAAAALASSSCSPRDADPGAAHPAMGPELPEPALDEPNRASPPASPPSSSDATSQTNAPSVEAPSEPVTCQPDLIDSQAELDALEGCQISTTGLVISFAGADLRPLHALRIAAQGITLGTGVEPIPSLEGLENLERAPLALQGVLVEDLRALSNLRSLASGVEPLFAGGLQIIDCPNLTSLEGLQNIALGDGPLIIAGNPRLTSLSPLELSAEAGLVDLLANAALLDLSALHSLTHVDALSFRDMPQTTLDDFSRLTSARQITISDNAALIDSSGIANLESVGSLSFYRNPALRALPHFARLTRASSITVEENSSLERIDNFPELTSLLGSDPEGVDGGRLTIVENAALTEVALGPALDGAHAIAILRNPQLVSVVLAGLEAIDGALVVASNPVLEPSALARLEAISAPYRKIAGNQPEPVLADPCPWTRDRFCDEPPVDGLCTLGSDASDCSTDPKYNSVHNPNLEE